MSNKKDTNSKTNEIELSGEELERLFNLRQLELICFFALDYFLFFDRYLDTVMFDDELKLKTLRHEINEQIRTGVNIIRDDYELFKVYKKLKNSFDVSKRREFIYLLTPFCSTKYQLASFIKCDYRTINKYLSDDQLAKYIPKPVLLSDELNLILPFSLKYIESLDIFKIVDKFSSIMKGVNNHDGS